MLLGMVFCTFKRRKDNSVSVQGLIIRSHTRIGINIIILWTLDIGVEVREQVKILAACHLDPIAGHIGEKRTVKRITERYIWNV